MTVMNLLFKRLLVLILLFASTLTALADEPSMGYQMALLDERSQNPQSVLLNKKIKPSNAQVREFEWLLETLRSRCPNPSNEIVMTLVQSWRTVERRGYKVTLLQLSRKITDLSNLAFQSKGNQKIDINRVVFKILKDQYPPKN